MNQIKTKICCTCHLEKPRIEFHKRKNSVRSDCKKCESLNHKKWVKENPEKAKHLLNQWRSKNPDKIKKHKKNSYLRNSNPKQRHDEQYYKDRELLKFKTTKTCNTCHIKKAITEFYKSKNTIDGMRVVCKICMNKENEENNIKHKKERCITRNKREKNKVKNDINYRIMRAIRSSQRHAIKNNQKSGRSIDRLMASVAEYKICFESQFESWMNWENRGIGPGTWQEDHIIPIKFFNMSDLVEQYMCFRLQNLRPISWEENRKKFDNIIE
ncbi:MAG: hypothetical protein WC554_17670, partial [Clostridia bacterium]